jgi:hypothetical protein
MNLITPPNAAAQVPDATTNTHVSSSCLHDVSHVFPYPLADVMMLFLPLLLSPDVLWGTCCDHDHTRFVRACELDASQEAAAAAATDIRALQSMEDASVASLSLYLILSHAPWPVQPPNSIGAPSRRCRRRRDQRPIVENASRRIVKDG